MIIAHLIRRLASPDPDACELDETEAYRLLGALLDDGVPELETGALLFALATRPLGARELTGLRRAAQERINRLPLPQSSAAGGPRPIVIPSYGGALHQPNLMPLVALLLARFGVATLVHGTLESHGGIASAQVFRELGVLPCAALSKAQRALEERRLAFVPTALLAPALAQLLSLRARLGTDNCAQRVAGLLDPFDGAALKLIPASDAAQQETFAAALLAHDERALLFVGTEGEAYPDPQQRPAIERIDGAAREPLFDADPAPLEARGAHLPEGIGAKETAQWIERALEGRVSLPQPVVNLLSCCLYACGYTEDFSQSKAIVAVRAHGHAPA